MKGVVTKCLVKRLRLRNPPHLPTGFYFPYTSELAGSGGAIYFKASEFSNVPVRIIMRLLLL